MTGVIKQFWLGCLTAFILFLGTGISFAQETHAAPEDSSNSVQSESIDDNPLNAQSDESSISIESAGWQKAVGLVAGVGPAFDLRDPALGYSAKVGFDFHGKYVGVGFEVDWDMIWSVKETKRSDNRDADFRTTYTALLLVLNGYLPASDKMVFKLGMGAGLGRIYDKVFSDKHINEDGTSWMARANVGAFWVLYENVTLGMDLEFNLGNYTDLSSVCWTDDKLNLSMGLVMTVSYQVI